MSSKIYLFAEDALFPKSIKKSALKKWIASVAELHGAKIEGLNYIFCSDDYLLEINKSYLNHDYYTDIITFPYQEGSTVESDIYISLDRVKDNATKLKLTYEQELLRVIIHGLLHLIGFNDKSPAKKKVMRAEEDRALAIWELC
jgi:probable rRNA maturation factor